MIVYKCVGSDTVYYNPKRSLLKINELSWRKELNHTASQMFYQLHELLKQLTHTYMYKHKAKRVTNLRHFSLPDVKWQFMKHKETLP